MEEKAASHVVCRCVVESASKCSDCRLGGRIGYEPIDTCTSERENDNNIFIFLLLFRFLTDLQVGTNHCRAIILRCCGNCISAIFDLIQRFAQSFIQTGKKSPTTIPFHQGQEFIFSDGEEMKVEEDESNEQEDEKEAQALLEENNSDK